MPVEKRGADGEVLDPTAVKKSRTEDAGTGANGQPAAGASTKSLDAIAKAKKVLELQAKLKERLNKLPQARFASAACEAVACVHRQACMGRDGCIPRRCTSECV